jgi:hypothetical protein
MFAGPGRGKKGLTPNAAKKGVSLSRDLLLRQPITGSPAVSTRAERPRGRAAEQSDELAPLHSITSSARARKGGESR